MDFVDYQDLRSKSHYEYVKETNPQLNSSEQVKKTAFQAMRELEGWCTEHKASLLIDLILMVKPQIVVEIGVWGGKSLIPMAYALKENGCGKIHGIDPWSSSKSAEGMEGVNKEWWGTVDHEPIMKGLVQKIQQFGLNNQIELIRKCSEDASPIFDIDLLHVDGNHSEKTSLYDVQKWVPLMRKGGVVIFDDITWGTTTQAVNWLDQNCIKLAEIRGDSVWGIWIKP
jgi:predicted O-methyltransferase YrrM